MEMKIVETLIAPNKFQNTVEKNFEVKMCVGKDPDKFRKNLKFVEFVPDKYFFVSKKIFLILSTKYACVGIIPDSS